MAKRAKKLLGVRLDGGWTVTQLALPSASATGGLNSVCYRVEKDDGTTGFMKALDLTQAKSWGMDFASGVKFMTDAFLFERNLLQKCVERRMDKVVRLIDTGEYIGTDDDFPIPYLIFEHAEADIRAEIEFISRLQAGISLRILHHLAIGLNQLHTSNIAHQDLKPSNALRFPNNVTKLGDLGSASLRGNQQRHDSNAHAGEKTYAPIELQYTSLSDEWDVRRFACDAYLLGSMAIFLFTGTAMTPALLSKLHYTHHWHNWGSKYADVLPYVREAFDEVMEDFEASLPTWFDADIRSRMVTAVRQLCEPDPQLRGHPITRRDAGNTGNKYSVYRYISEFNLIAKRAEVRMTGGGES